MSLTPGFNLEEAKSLLAIIATLQGPTPPLPLPDIPSIWEIVFNSPVIGAFENKWQLWKRNDSSNNYAIIIRGTVTKAGSIAEDLLSVMIKAKGRFPIGKFVLPYQFSEDPDAGIHLGFTMGVWGLIFHESDGILYHLNKSVPAGSQIFLAGHSQGAAIVTLCRSFLYYSDILRDRSYSYKTYVFAQPKPGNDHYGNEFLRTVGKNGMTHRITKSLDWVPQVPFTIERASDINSPNPLTILQLWHLHLASLLSIVVQFFVRMRRKQKLKIHLKSLEALIKEQRLQVKEEMTDPLELPLLSSVYFSGCGPEIVLRGEAGGNPSDKQDFMWQHHAAMYWKLLEQESESMAID